MTKLSLHSQAKRANTMAGKRNKYRNVPTEVDGIRFASKLEAARYSELKLLERTHHINRLAIHPRWKIEVNGLHICDYEGDFHYYDMVAQKYVAEDTKGIITADCRIKLALMRAVHEIDVVLIKKVRR